MQVNTDTLVSITEASDTEVNEISQRLMKRNTHVYQELAK